jgi:hypothetical protein
MTRCAASLVLAVIAIICIGNLSVPRSSGSEAGENSILEYHNSPGRDGVYVDSTMTKASAAAFHIDPTFNAQIHGAIYAQLLYVAKGVKGKDVIIAASEANNVAALDASTGKALWTINLGNPVPLRRLPCGNIDPLGITGTPVIDMASHTIFLDAMTTPDNGTTKKHLIFALSLSDGSVVRGWPVDVSAKVVFGKTAFDSSVQNQRGALAFVKGTVYIPYGGHYGDCGHYHGWLVGIPSANPAALNAWATGAVGGGSWAPGGVAHENNEVFIATGNTFGTDTWAGGEALLRFSAGGVFSGRPADYFTPINWRALDDSDLDLGGTGPLVLDLPGSRPSKLLVALGKDGKLYLVDRTNMGGVGNQVTVSQVAVNPIIGGAATYTTARGTYVVFKGKGSRCPPGQSGDLTAVRIVPGSPPGVQAAWCAKQNGMGSPMVTTTDGHAEAIVWSVGAEGDNRLHGFDGDTGKIIYSGAGPREVIGQIRRYQTPILAGSRIFVAADNTVKAFVR